MMMLKLFAVSVILSSQIFGQSHFIAQLISIHSNASQVFKINGKSFSCSAYGITVLHKIAQTKQINPICQDEIKKFFDTDPTKLSVASKYLHVKSFYDLIYVKGQCLIYASGQKSLSEILLENGLAVIEHGFHDEEFDALFLKAQRHAQENKLGVWSDNTLKICALGLYK
jgi:hypothetical protein